MFYLDWIKGISFSHKMKKAIKMMKNLSMFYEVRLSMDCEFRNSTIYMKVYLVVSETHSPWTSKPHKTWTSELAVYGRDTS